MPALTLVPEQESAAALGERSAEAREILGRVPHWTLRYGLGGLAGAFLLALVLSWLVRYPDVLTGRVRLASLDPPAPVIAPEAGRIVRFQVQDGQGVRRGDTLALLQSSADPDAIDALEAWLERLPEDLSDPLSAEGTQPPVNHALGEVLPAYAAFIRAFDDHRFLHVLDPVRIESTPIQQEIGETEELLAARKAQLEALDREIALLRQSRQRLSVLAADGLVARDELTRSERDIARAVYNREAAVADIATTRVDRTRLERQLKQLQLDYAQRGRDRQHRLNEARRQLIGALAEWNHRYRLSAPRDGRVSLNRIWSAHQVVNAGEELLTIVAPGGTLTVGRIELAASGSGKVATGDRVMLRLDRYPYDEFGALEATVTAIDGLPRNGIYRVDISLNDGLKTTAGKTLSPAAELHGEARIVTEDRRLLSRLFGRLRGGD